MLIKFVLLVLFFAIHDFFILFDLPLSTDGLRQAKANPDRDVEHMRCPSFKLFTDEKTKAKAAEKCIEWGGKLASLNTVAKAQFVSGMLEEGQWAWIGGDCVGCAKCTEDKWMWLSGDRLDLQNPLWKEYGSKKTPYEA